MKIKRYILIALLGFFLAPGFALAQNDQPEDDLGNVSDEFQELFFEALKQKAIENYEKSIESLQKCLKIDDSKAVVYFELGKNYNKLKNFGEAEDVLKKAIDLEPSNEWYLDELYDIYYQQRDFEKAIKTVKQLVKYHPDYKEDLASLYISVKKYNQALKLLDELDKEQGVSITRDRMRNQIYNITGRDKDRIENLEERVEASPDNEANYLKLIYRYSESGETEKAYDTAIELLKINPNSQLVHLALYKFYLDDGREEDAVASMKIVLQSAKISADAKVKVLNDFIKFVNAHPEYEDELLEATTLVSKSENGKTNLEIAQYYLLKGDKPQALKYFDLALKYEPDNFGIIRNILLLHIDLLQYQDAAVKSREAIDAFPAQPFLYLINGVALNRLNKPEEAIEVLSEGVDYVIEDNKMLSDFYKQLSEGYAQTNDRKKAQEYSKKASKLESE